MDSMPPTLTKPMDLPGLATNCEESAKYYEHNPGMTAHHGIVPDLYRTVALLARMVEDLQNCQLRGAAVSEDNDVTNARIVLGLSRNRFHGYDGGVGPGMPIVCQCIHCARLFVSRSHDLADLDHICKGDCGCQKQSRGVELG